MAVIKVKTPGDFQRVVARVCSRDTHVVVTNPAGRIVVVPTVTSRHRHYVVIEADEETVRQLLNWLSSMGYTIVEGEVDFRG